MVFRFAKSFLYECSGQDKRCGRGLAGPEAELFYLRKIRGTRSLRRRVLLRQVVACFFLAVIACQGTAEIALLVSSHPLPTIFAKKTSNAASDSSESITGGSSCCAEKPSCCADDSGEPEITSAPPHDMVVCTCRCCGSVCPMGAKCTCNAPKVHVSSDFMATIVFRPMTCHPADPLANGWLPPSLQYSFLPALSYHLPAVAVIERPYTRPAFCTLGVQRPPVPPPKSIA